MPMKILGANGLIGGTPESLDNIPSNAVNDGDLALVLNGEEWSFYILDGDNGGAETLPNIIVPDDIIPIGSSPKRWKLIGGGENTANVIIQSGSGLFTNIITAPGDDLHITSYENGGITINNAGDLIVENDAYFEEDIYVDGQIISTNTTQAPMIVSSSIMVVGLNTEFVGGVDGDDLMTRDGSRTFSAPIVGVTPTAPTHLVTKAYSDAHGTALRGTESIPSGVSSLSVTFSSVLASANYIVITEVTNVVDAIPSVYAKVVTDKQATGFTIDFSDTIDSSNYKLQYLVALL